MSCQPVPSSQTPIERLRLAAEAFALLAPTASKQQVTNAYQEYREALFESMTVDIDPKRYDVAWQTIKNFGDAELEALGKLPESVEAYAPAIQHLQLLVRDSYAYVPWG